MINMFGDNYTLNNMTLDPMSFGYGMVGAGFSGFAAPHHACQYIPIVTPTFSQSSVLSATSSVCPVQASPVILQSPQPYEQPKQEQTVSEPEIDWNKRDDLTRRELWLKQNITDTVKLRRELDGVRKCRQKTNRTDTLSFLIKLLRDVGFAFKLENPQKLSKKTFCLVVEEIIDPQGVVQETYQGFVWTINEMYKNESSPGKKQRRNDIRECAMVMTINCLLFYLEEYGGYVHYGERKKDGKHRLFTTETIDYVVFNGVTYTYADILTEGNEHFNSTLKHSLGMRL